MDLEMDNGPAQATTLVTDGEDQSKSSKRDPEDQSKSSKRDPQDQSKSSKREPEDQSNSSQPLFSVTQEPSEERAFVQLTFDWDIDSTNVLNYHKNAEDGKKKYRYVGSNPFELRLPDGKVTEWRMVMEPCYSVEGERYVGLMVFLSKLDASSEQPFVDVIYELQLLSGNGKVITRKMSSVRRFSQGHNCHGWLKFLPYSYLLANQPHKMDFRAKLKVFLQPDQRVADQVGASSPVPVTESVPEPGLSQPANIQIADSPEQIPAQETVPPAVLEQPNQLTNQFNQSQEESVQESPDFKDPAIEKEENGQETKTVTDQSEPEQLINQFNQSPEEELAQEPSDSNDPAIEKEENTQDANTANDQSESEQLINQFKQSPEEEIAQEPSDSNDPAIEKAQEITTADSEPEPHQLINQFNQNPTEGTPDLALDKESQDVENVQNAEEPFDPEISSGPEILNDPEISKDPESTEPQAVGTPRQILEDIVDKTLPSVLASEIPPETQGQEVSQNQTIPADSAENPKNSEPAEHDINSTITANSDENAVSADILNDPATVENAMNLAGNLDLLDPDEKAVDLDHDAVARAIREMVADLWVTKGEANAKVICEGQVYPVHSYVLKARSPVFRAHFESKGDTADFDASAHLVSAISAVFSSHVNLDMELRGAVMSAGDGLELEALLEYCYTGSTNLFQDFERTAELLVLAKALEVTSLVKRCIEEIMKMMTYDKMKKAYAFVAYVRSLEGVAYDRRKFLSELVELKKGNREVLADMGHNATAYAKFFYQN